MAAYYRPQTSPREAALQPASAAICFIDVQVFNCCSTGAMQRDLPPAEQAGEARRHFMQRVEECKPLWASLQQACRSAGVEVLYTVIQSLTMDGRDRGRDYKLSGFHVPPGSRDAQVLDCIPPGPDEIVLPKTSSSVFLSTPLHYLLQNLGVRQLVLCGCVTDQCVEHAVRDACDLGYLVTLATDACATHSIQRQQASLAAVVGYCRQRTADQLVQELAEAHPA
ncbi:Peroxyureidoacrylate/ureidoacrylate amidohydrolase RutB [Chlorella vulgaris]